MQSTLLVFLRRHSKPLIWFGLSLLCFASVLVPPDLFWPAVFLSYAIPIVLVLNVLFMLIFGALRKRQAVFFLGATICGAIFIRITFTANSQTSTKVDDIRVLSFNAKLFRKAKTYAEFSPDMIQWVVNDTSQIKCIQEYSTNSRWPGLDVTGQMQAKGYNAFAYRSLIKPNEHSRGLAIFSSYPIIGQGTLWEDSTNINGGIYADLKINQDTLRIYNVHLASMYLDLSEFKKSANYFHKVRYLTRQLKRGAILRTEQVRIIREHVARSHHKVIICGDFNETPYSYNYFKMRRHFMNAFEKAGRGFGFSHNSGAFFLRIDHQFCSQGILPVAFGVDHGMKISDHFPTRGVYRLTN